MGNPRLAPHVRLDYDAIRGTPVLLAPESVTTLNDTGAAIVSRCDGTRSVEQITAELAQEYEGVQLSDIEAFVAKLRSLHCLARAAEGRTQ